MSRATGKTVRGRPMTPREQLGYELDLQHLERLSKAVARDMRIPISDLYKFHDAAQAITRILRPFLKGKKAAHGKR